MHKIKAGGHVLNPFRQGLRADGSTSARGLGVVYTPMRAAIEARMAPLRTGRCVPKRAARPVPPGRAGHSRLLGGRVGESYTPATTTSLNTRLG